jgi:lysozyme
MENFVARISDTFDLSDLRDELTLDEGVKSRPYTDTVGNVTIGRGRNLSAVGLSLDEIEYLWANDVARACVDLDAHLAWWRTLPAQQQRVMINLAFNMGIDGLLSFEHFLDAMQRQDWIVAAGELQDSKWWGEVGFRGPRMVARLEGWKV